MTTPAAAGTPVAAFDYDLPADRIAQRPLERRDASRLLHLPPAGPPRDHRFGDLPGLLAPGDLLVVNDTRVRAARLLGEREGGGRAELLVLERRGDRELVCLVRPARRLAAGTVVDLGAGLRAIVGPPTGGHPGSRLVTVLGAAGADLDRRLEQVGEVPLPPYVRARLDQPARYQTVYAASPPESAAAPTAGLHFTAEVLTALRERGVEVASVRLQVGLATFAPMTAETIEDHTLHEERYRLPAETARAIVAARVRGGRVVATGTTVCRVLETRAAGGGLVTAGEGSTRLFLRPGRPFEVVDGLLTNFHMPRSSLLVLLAAFVGGDRWREAYSHALENGYRFLSFGDCMLCWRAG